MESYLEIAEQNQLKAKRVIDNLQIKELWIEAGARVNLVGSLKTGLLMKHRDIDFHVYTDIVSKDESQSVINKIAENPSVKRVMFSDLLDTDENCLEWHLYYLDEENNEWQIDIIHMPFKSKYSGYFENIADRITAVMTPDIRETILKLKYETPDDVKISGIEYYFAVIEYGVKTYDEFTLWRRQHPSDGIIHWCP